MIFIRYVHVRPYRRVVLFRDDQPVRIFYPGRRLILRFGRHHSLATFDVRQPPLDLDRLEALIKSELLDPEVASVRLRRHERALVWIDGRLDRVLGEGLHAFSRAFYNVQIETYSTYKVYFQHPALDMVRDSGLLDDDTESVEVGDRQRALVWVDGRFERILSPGLHMLWTTGKRVRVELLEVGDGHCSHADLETIVRSDTSKALELFYVEADHEGLLLRDGRFDRSLEPGLHAFWRGVARFELRPVDLREQMLDIAGQDVMTADKVTVRTNAVVTFRVEDARAALQASESYSQALYREAQLALRAILGTRELDALLAEKSEVTRELDQAVREKAASLGLEVLSLGLRDLILPGEMRALMNRVTEAKKAAEANLIARREETQAMRSQANTARIFESNPTLLKLRELEVLEKVAERADLKVVLGETGLAERLVQMV